MGNIIQIPNILENNIEKYLKTISAITYNVSRAFTVEPYALPLVIIKAGKLAQLEPGTGVFEGSFEIFIISQIDEVTDVLETHDEITGQVYDAMENEPALSTVFNENGQLWFLSLESIEQTKEDRNLTTLLEYKVSCQNLTLE